VVFFSCDTSPIHSYRKYKLLLLLLLYPRSITATSLLTDFASCGLRWRRWFVGALNKRSVIRTNIIWISIVEQGENAVRHHRHRSTFVSCKHYTAETWTAVCDDRKTGRWKKRIGEEDQRKRGIEKKIKRKEYKRRRYCYIYIILLYLLLYCGLKNGVRSTDTECSAPSPREKRSVVFTGARFLTGLLSARAHVHALYALRCLAGVRKPSYRVQRRRVQQHVILLHLLLLLLGVHLLFKTRVRLSPARHRPQTTAAHMGGRRPWNIK